MIAMALCDCGLHFTEHEIAPMACAAAGLKPVMDVNFVEPMSA